ncbi:MAG TPA: FlgD immunoglobulin-like domain containing protein [Methylomirabilota bacterium]|nr:FlgD immunoglobulin-like domain containing protein [Methylomirabilota bacterium]
MRRIVLLAALFALAAPARAAQSPAHHGATPVATSALLALAPDRATIAQATQRAPTAPVYFITASAAGSGSINPSGVQPVTPGADQTFTMTPLPCALLDNVRVDGVDLGPLTTYTFHNVSADHTIEASFVPAPPDTIVATAGSHGTISPAGVTVYDCGATATYTIAPDSCSLIGDVLVDGRSAGAVPVIRFVDLRASHTIHATFVPAVKYTITATTGANGTITPPGATQVGCGLDQTFTISPFPCFKIADVLVDGASQGPITSYTFTNVLAAHSISASFVSAAARDTIVASAGPNGTIDPAGMIVVNCGVAQTFTFGHDPCYRVADVVVDGVSRGPMSSFTFASVNSSHTISASFVSAPQYPITATAGSGGTIVPSGTVQVDCGGSQTFTVIPPDPLVVPAIFVDGVYQDSTTSYTFTNVNDAHSIVAAFTVDYWIDAFARRCNSTGIKPTILGEGFPPDASYWFDVQPLHCDPPAPGAHLEKAGKVLTDAFGSIVFNDTPCYPVGEYTIILDVLGTGAYVPTVDPIACFKPNNATPTSGIDDLEGEITSEGAVLSWWVMDLSTYRGFIIHRAQEGGDEEAVTRDPLAPPSSHPPAQMRWRDATALPGARYEYRIEALKPGSGADWYGPVTLAIPAEPRRLALRGATPNPFGGTTRLAIDVPSGEGELRLDVFDVAGRHVRTLRRGAMSPGQDVVDWDGRDDHGARTRGGLYVVRLQGAHGTSVTRVMKLD